MMLKSLTLWVLLALASAQTDELKNQLGDEINKELGLTNQKLELELNQEIRRTVNPIDPEERVCLLVMEDQKLHHFEEVRRSAIKEIVAATAGQVRHIGPAPCAGNTPTDAEEKLAVRFASPSFAEHTDITMRPVNDDEDNCDQLSTDFAIDFSVDPGPLDNFNAAIQGATAEAHEMDVESQEVVANADAVELAEVKAEAHDGTVRVHMKAKLHLTRLTILKPCFLLVNLNILGRPVMRKLHFWWWCRGCRYNYKYYKHGSVRTIGKKLCPCQKCTCRHGTWYCKNQRRSVEDLSTLERGIYVAALIHLKNEGRTPGFPQDLTTPTIMQFFNHHGTFGGDAHWNPHFLPWHREYLRHLEAEMMESWREIQSSAALQTWAIALFAEQGITISASDITNNCVALPYWAWEHDSGLVANTRKFSETSTFGGGGGGSGNNHCVMDGMAGWTADLNTYDWRIVGDCLKRSYSMGGTVNTYDLTDWANHLTINGYCSFANSAEAGIHYAPHTYVQQTMGSVPTAGREFLFYLHHNNIDRLWHEWQQYSPANTYDYSDCGSSKGLHSPMPPFDGTTYPEATPDDVISHKMWKHTCKPPVYGPIIAWPAHLTVAAAWPVLWSVSLRTSRTCYGAEWVPHGKKCSLIGSGGVLTWNITVALAKIFEAGLGGKIPSAGKLQSAAKLDEMFNPAAWRAFGFNEEQTQHLRNARSASKLSSADKLRWAPFFKEDSRRELFGGMPEEWISEGGLDALLQEARKLHADTCSSDFRADSFFDITV